MGSGIRNKPIPDPGPGVKKVPVIGLPFEGVYRLTEIVSHCRKLNIFSRLYLFFLFK